MDKIKQKIKEKILKKSKKAKKKYKLLEKKNIEKDTIIERVKNPIKLRNPGVDLCRILDMFAIVTNHILGSSGFKKKFNQYNILKIIYASLNWHNCGFIFISGYIGYKTTKYSNLIYLWFWTFFYYIGIDIYFIKFKPHTYKESIKFLDFFPVLTYQYWYFTCYFGTYLFLPVINKGLEIITKSQLKITIISFILFYVILKDYINPTNDIFRESNGNSVLWFLIFYITGAYFGKFKKENENISGTKKFIYCIIYILIFYFSTYLSVKSPYYEINSYNPNFMDKIKLFIKLLFVVRNSSVVQISQSISIILFFTSIKYNKYIGKIIIFIGPLTYAVYLIHCHPIIFNNIFKKHFKNNYSSNLPLNTVLKIIILKATQTFVICIIIDYFRNILFKVCQIRKISILIEKLILKLFVN